MLQCNVADISIKQGGWAGLHLFRGAEGGQSPQSDTNPLTRCKRLYYVHPRLARHTPKPKEEPQHRGNTIPGPHEDSTSQPIPKGGPYAAPRLKRKPPSPHTKGPGSPSPHNPGDGRSVDYKRHALSRAPCRYNAPLIRSVYLALTGEYADPANGRAQIQGL